MELTEGRAFQVSGLGQVEVTRLASTLTVELFAATGHRYMSADCTTRLDLA